MLEQLSRASMSKRVGPGRAQIQQPAVRLARAIVKPQHPEQWAEGNLPVAEAVGSSHSARLSPERAGVLVIQGGTKLPPGRSQDQLYVLQQESHEGNC